MHNKDLIVLSSPSGGGKSTLAKHLIANFPLLEFSISCTTRGQRDGEVNTKDYYFITSTEFETKLANDEFAESELIFGNRYGTLKSEIDKILKSGKKVLFDVDVKGALSLKRVYGDSTLLIFIKPPTISELERRLLNRGTETQEQVSNRLSRAEEELNHEKEFDYILINDNLEKAKQDILDIVSKYEI